MKILLHDFNAKVGREGIFKPIIWNESPHEISNDNGVTVVSFVISKNLVVKSTMFPYRDINKYIWPSPGGKTHNHIHHVLRDRRRYFSITDVRSFRRADCDSDHYLVVAKVRERLAVSKLMTEKMDMEKFNINNLNEEEVKEQYKVTIKNKFAVLENFDDNVNINRGRDIKG
jgi:hypothetical protein